MSGQPEVGSLSLDYDHATQGRVLRRIERREWWLWATAVAITLLLTAGILSFLPVLSRSVESPQPLFSLQSAMWGLVCLVLLFDLYTIYQQLQIQRIRRRLFEREELFRLISENAADMIAVVDMEGKRIYNSLSYERVLGYSPEELKSSSSFEQIHPEDRENVRNAAFEARRTGIGKTLEYRIRRKDGTWCFLESTSSVIRTPSGVPEKMIIINRDITARKQAAESIRSSEAAFRSMVEDAPYGIVRTDSQGKLISANPAFERMLAYEQPAELLRANLATDIFVDTAEFLKLRQRLEATGELKDAQIELRRKDANLITVRCSGRLSKEAHQGQPCVDLFAEDVTEKRILERQLQMAGKMEAIGRLSGGIAHDFNNLLGVMIGYSQLFRRKLDPQSPLLEYADEIQKAGQRAASLTRQLLAFSRQQILTPAVLNLNDLVADMERMLPRLLGEDVTVTTSLFPELEMVKADQGQIEQVIMNLAVNARDAMPNGGRLRIETANVKLDQAYVRHHPGAKLGDYVMLTVIDSGTGIDQETLPHIFEPFFTTKEIGKGTGLGLATVYGVVKQSGGYIWVNSEPGKGTEFEIYLPQVHEEISAAPSSAFTGSLQGTETILLVEDAEPLRKLTQTFLQSHGFRVLVAQDGDEAVELETQHSGEIHLLLTDVIMPGMNGRALAEALKPRHPEMRVLYTSGYTDSFIAVHGVLEQGKALLNKPFTEESLIKKVREVLDAEVVGTSAQNSSSKPARNNGKQ
jgi:two-component system, cell cycle sensor histidine kinase and response regulator CckA